MLRLVQKTSFVVVLIVANHAIWRNMHCGVEKRKKNSLYIYVHTNLCDTYKLPEKMTF